MLKLRQTLLADKVDIVHAYFPDACLLAPLYLKHSKLAIVTSRRDMGLIYQGKPAWLYGLLRHRTDKVIANSSAVADLVKHKERLCDKQVAVIHNGIEPFDAGPRRDVSIYRDDSSVKLILVANIKPVKRTLDAIKAVRHLVSQGHGVELALVGERQDPNYVEAIESYISAHHLEHNIHWLGQIDEPRRIIDQADIGLLISESEGLSNTIMEYLQAGLAVIASNVGGNPELIRDGKTGLLIEKGNVQQLCDSILAVASPQGQGLELGCNGKQLINEQFSLPAMIKNHERLYSALTQQKMGCTPYAWYR
jgi:glycosyltransferase involved in cell wall biosynthesis